MRSSLRDLEDFPPGVKEEFVKDIDVARNGGHPPSANPWKGEGSGVLELKQDDGDAYRVVYCVRFKDAMYILHAFNKKSTQGIKTSKRDIDLVSRRLSEAESHYEETFKKAKR